MGKRSTIEFHPVLIEPDTESLNGDKSAKRQKLLCQTAALALLSFRLNARESDVNECPKHTPAAPPSAVISATCSVGEDETSRIETPTVPKPLVTRSALPRMLAAPLTMPALPNKVQPKKVVLPKGKPLAVAPHLAKHLSLMTKPIDLRLT
eukprot:CAMPEP_0172440200 /NCGR_PEP_ID=MMETSP1065-20121228/915_1 /TAXON_ID=265537 /ORGANISM="Amphiprora paludosa, Strain CCMP125" /LENGTH=150 /DNA_ID=CAMNT_0013188985 /DNA_START=65 /DNA_END=517 /DNA_ORIENTATION=-